MYEKSLALNPENTNGTEVLARIRNAALMSGRRVGVAVEICSLHPAVNRFEKGALDSGIAGKVSPVLDQDQP